MRTIFKPEKLSARDRFCSFQKTHLVDQIRALGTGPRTQDPRRGIPHRSTILCCNCRIICKLMRKVFQLQFMKGKLVY